MNFAIFLWNTVMKVLGFIGWILLEVFVAYVILTALDESGYTTISYILWIIFIIFIILQIVFKMIKSSISFFKFFFK